MSVRILIGDCRERLRELPNASVDSVVCDPPYHLTSIVKRFGSENAAPAKSNGATGVYGRASKGFMGQTWDGGDVAFDPETWAEVLRVLKPGGHLIAFSGTRTYHRMVVAIEDAGFEIRDQLAWVYGSGFPKSLDVSKAIDKQRDDKPDVHRVCAFVAAGRDAAGKANREIDALFGFNGMAGHWTNSKGPQAQVPRWEQWLQLRAFLNLSDEMDAEVWRLNGRKGQPGEAWDRREVIGSSDNGIAGGTGKHAGMNDAYGFKGEFDITAPATDAAREWQGWGTALKPSWEPICLARKPLIGTVAANVLAHGTGALNIDGCRIDSGGEVANTSTSHRTTNEGWDRPWRHDDEGKARILAAKQEGNRKAVEMGRWPANLCHDGSEEVLAGFPETSSGAFNQASVTADNRIYGPHEGYANPKQYEPDTGSAARFFYCAKATTEERGEGNNHPTVKPVALMRWLIRLVTPKGGLVLDPFMGSGSTALACDAEQFDFIGCELSPEYAAIAEQRIRDAAGMFAVVKAA